MARKDMRPVAYVPREIRAFGDGGSDTVVGYFVSKAYIEEVVKWYDKNGKAGHQYCIEFMGGRELTYDMYTQQSERGVFSVEDHTADFKPKKWAFGSFKECKKCVCELNSEIAEQRRGWVKEYGATEHNKLWANLHKQAREFGKKLEEMYITEQERQPENTINF